MPISGGSCLIVDADSRSELCIYSLHGPSTYGPLLCAARRQSGVNGQVIAHRRGARRPPSLPRPMLGFGARLLRGEEGVLRDAMDFVTRGHTHCNIYNPPSLPTTSAGRPHTTKSESPGLLSKQRATDLLATPFPEKIGSTISADTRQKRILRCVSGPCWGRVNP